MATNSQFDDKDLEKFTLIWLDATINESENKTTQNDLHKLSNQFKPFDNSNQCQLYIQSLSIDERVVLIVSGRLGREIVPNIHEIEQIYLIYVYCFDREANERWVKDYSKIKKVLTTVDELIEQICQDNKREICPINNELLYINIYHDNPDDQFIHSQLLINYLLKMKIYSIIDPKFFILCRTEYPEENLDDFQENYSSENSLWWLTKDKFLSKLISKSFHTRNLDLLYLTRFYLRDINQQLELHQCSKRIQVYHSHLITTEEIEQLKNSIGKLISINTFFFTTFQRDNALRTFEQTNESEKILFEIDADPSIDRIKSFANITSFSYSKKQSQILFMLGTIFRIKNIFQQNHIWICQMNLSNENDQDLKNIFQQIQNEDGDSSTDILAFGNILSRINQYHHAEKYYQYILKEFPTNEITHICYQNLGNVAYLKKDYDQSLKYHLKSLEIKKYLLKSDDPSLADSYNCLGIVSFDKINYKQAIDYYEKGLNILQLKLNENHSKIMICLNNIALVYRMEENYLKAFDYYQKILDLTDDHSELGPIYHNIGAIYWCRGFYDDAMKYYNLSLENKYKFLPGKHPSIAMTLENMGLIYENKNDFQQAYKYYREATNIYQQTLPSTHSDIVQIKDNILRVSSQLK